MAADKNELPRERKRAAHGIAFWGSGAFMLLFSAPNAHAGGSSIKLAGHVPSRASVWLSSWSTSSINLQPGSQRLKMADLLISANNKHFTISIQSENADDAGNPTLLDPTTGASLGYSVEISPAISQIGRPSEQGAQSVEVIMAPSRRYDTSSLQDRLHLVIKAR